MGRRSNGSNTSPTSSTEDGDATLQDETARLLSGAMPPPRPRQFGCASAACCILGRQPTRIRD
jgi:hypothetical protein